MTYFYFTPEFLTSWDGRLIVLNAQNKGLACYDFKTSGYTNLTIQAELRALEQKFPLMTGFTFDWKEYVQSKGAGEVIAWKSGRHIKSV